MGNEGARLAADAILGKKKKRRAGASPRVIFTKPWGGPSGSGRPPWRRPGSTSRSTSRPRATRAGRSWAAKRTARLVVDEDRRVVVGATITGSEVAEALHAATIAVIGGVPLDDLWQAAVPSFPTRSELGLPAARGLRAVAEKARAVRRVAATRYVTALREGGSVPAVVEADDDGLYVVKFRAAAQGPGARGRDGRRRARARARVPRARAGAHRARRGVGRASPPGDPGAARSQRGLNLGDGLPARRAAVQPGGRVGGDPALAADVVRSTRS